MPQKRTRQPATNSRSDSQESKRSRLEEEAQDAVGAATPVKTNTLPIPTDGKLRPLDLRVHTHGFYDLPCALGVLSQALHIYPVRPAEFEGDDDDLEAELDEQPGREVPLERVAFLQRLENDQGLERYRLVFLASSDGGGEETVEALEFDLAPFSDNATYLPSELRALPLPLRNLRNWFATYAPSVRYLDNSYEAAPPIGERTHVTVVINPTAGGGQAKSAWGTVEGLLQLAAGTETGKAPEEESWVSWNVEETQSAGDGERIGRALVERVEREKDEMRKTDKNGRGKARREAVMVFGGDGTVHEVLNGLLAMEMFKGAIQYDRVKGFAGELVLLPFGTGNAIYHHHFPPSNPLYPTDKPLSRFYSLLSFLVGASPAASAQPAGHASAFSGPVLHRTVPVGLPIAQNSLPGHEGLKPVFTAVVSSAALHAAILNDAEALRANHPGLERFKLAAQQNASRWVSGTLKLDGQGRPVRRYWAAQKQWVGLGPHGDEEFDEIETVYHHGAETQHTVEGDFAYVVAALTDRFEPTFVPAPFRSPSSALNPLSTANYANISGSIDVVVIRPLRHKPTAELVAQGKGDEARERFVQRVWEVSGKMYEEGAHVDLVYPEEERAEEGEQGAEVVEVYRCDHFEWIPFTHLSFAFVFDSLLVLHSLLIQSSRADPKDRLVCLDGTLFDLGKAAGGSLKTKALNPEKTQITVWA
ncbi:hypothetical protein JCM8097_003467 [Rhodosporidiobolus ruineniae]